MVVQRRRRNPPQFNSVNLSTPMKHRTNHTNMFQFARLKQGIDGALKVRIEYKRDSVLYGAVLSTEAGPIFEQAVKRGISGANLVRVERLG